MLFLDQLAATATGSSKRSTVEQIELIDKVLNKEMLLEMKV